MAGRHAYEDLNNSISLYSVALIQLWAVQRDACSYVRLGNDCDVGIGIDIGLLKFRCDCFVLRTEN